MRDTNGWRTTSASVNSTTAMPWTPMSVSSASRIPDEPRQEHLHLHGRGVLRLVEDDEGVGERAPAHEGERRDLDIAGRKPFHHLLARQHVVQRVVKGS